jgi:aerobic carbon-monoxide dehydrogenase large subunit
VSAGGAIPPPAAIFNAVNDALRRFGVEMTETPLRPQRLRAALAGSDTRPG